MTNGTSNHTTKCPACGKINRHADDDGYTEEAPREYHAECWMAPISIYVWDGEQIAAKDLATAVEVLAGRRADARAAEATGLTVSLADLDEDQRYHLKRHGWCEID